MRNTPSGRAGRTTVRRLALLTVLFVALGGALLGFAGRASAAGPDVSLLSSTSWTDYLGTTRMLHLVAEVQNNDSRDASLVTVTFDLFDAHNNSLGFEPSAGSSGLDIIGAGGRSSYGADVVAPANYDHATAWVSAAAVAATSPDHNFTIVPTACPDLVDRWHVCGTITNNNSIRVAGVRVAVSFYADLARSQVADGEAYSLPTDGSSSLAAGASFAFELVRSAGSPDWVAIAMIGESSTTTPAAPVDAYAVAQAASATVSWSAPPLGDLPVTGYTVTSSPGALTASVSGAARSATVGGLHNGTAYTFTVTATNDYGTGPASSPSNAVTPAGVPDAPVITATAAGNSSVAVSWNAPFDEGSPITRYTVNSIPATPPVVVDGNSTSATVSGLSNGTTYSFTVSASNALGTGPSSYASPPVTPATVPGAPTNVVATAGDGSATVTWGAPGWDGGASISSYTVTSSPRGVTVMTTGDARSATLGSLQNGTSYSFAVAASNRAGTSAASSSNSVTPSAAPAPPPPPPPEPAFGPWQILGGRLGSRPVSISSAPGRLDTFVSGLDGLLWHSEATTPSWEPVRGSRPTSEVSAVSRSSGTIDVFMRGPDLALWHNFRSGTGWSGWTSLGGRLASAPSAVVAGSEIDVFVQGVDAQLWLERLPAAGQPTWTSAGGRILGNPAAVAGGAGQVGAFVLGADRALWFWSAGGSWIGYGGRVSGNPTAVSPQAGRLEAFVQGTDGALWQLSGSFGSTSRQWSWRGGLLSASPVSVTEGTRLDVFVRGTDGGLWHDGFNGNPSGPGWAWENLGGQLVGAPGAVSPSPGHLDVFIWSSDGSLRHRAA